MLFKKLKIALLPGYGNDARYLRRCKKNFLDSIFYYQLLKMSFDLTDNLNNLQLFNGKRFEGINFKLSALKIKFGIQPLNGNNLPSSLKELKFSFINLLIGGNFVLMC